MAFYLDNAATTGIRPSALEVMVPLLAEEFGNPSGAHRMARAANRVLDDARETMAACLGAEPGEIIFTSGGTESDNLAIQGSLTARPGIAVCSAIEHHAVLDPVEHAGGRVVRVNEDGLVDLDHLADCLAGSEDVPVSVVSIMLANNETGVIQPLDQIERLVRKLAPEALLHTDAVQAMCWLDVAELTARADLVSVSAHKFGGPKGVGVMVARSGKNVEPLFRGGGQERGRRGGTHNVAGIAAMAVAAKETVAERATQVPRVSELRDRLADGIVSTVEGVFETGVTSPAELQPSDSTKNDKAKNEAKRINKIANICHLCFADVESEALLFLLEKDDIMASAASSCSSGAIEPSHVLTAMGFDRQLAFGSLRLSLGYGTTEADVEAALNTIPPAVQRLRERA